MDFDSLADIFGARFREPGEPLHAAFVNGLLAQTIDTYSLVSRGGGVLVATRGSVASGGNVASDSQGPQHAPCATQILFSNGFLLPFTFRLNSDGLVWVRSQDGKDHAESLPPAGILKCRSDLFPAEISVEASDPATYQPAADTVFFECKSNRLSINCLTLQSLQAIQSPVHKGLNSIVGRLARMFANLDQQALVFRDPFAMEGLRGLVCRAEASVWNVIENLRRLMRLISLHDGDPVGTTIAAVDDSRASCTQLENLIAQFENMLNNLIWRTPDDYKSQTSGESGSELAYVAEGCMHVTNEDPLKDKTAPVTAIHIL